jgi:SPX domain protein involved in polyphosphate accumulation
VSRIGEVRLERREFKYLIPSDLVPLVREAARIACRPDPYAGPDGSYRIRSLYLDNARLDLFHANEAEAPDRYKARVRCYPDTSSPVFLEIKRRVKDVVVKTRAAVPQSRWQETVGGRTLDLASPRHARALEHFQALVHANHLHPLLLVEYAREAYMSDVDEYARVTFDTEIACQTRDIWDLGADDRRWSQVRPPSHTVMEPCYTVLELKFGDLAPRWMQAMVRRFDLIRHSFSKYCYGVRSEGALPGQRVPALGLG